MIVSQKRNKVKGPEDVARIVLKVMAKETSICRDREHFYVIGLNGANTTIYVELAFLGALDSCPVQPREIFRHAIARGCGAVITAHNHPSDEVKHSLNDQLVWDKIDSAAEIIGIKCLDHLVVGPSGAGYSRKKNVFFTIEAD